jgi:c-di-AMP phosphodiesterase-like protein
MLEKLAAEGSRKNKEALDRLLKESDRVFIVAHNRPDMDAIGSAIGMSLICKKKKKESYIVLDDDFDNGEEVASRTIKATKNEFKYIRAKDLNSLLTNNSLMIALDVNQEPRMATKNHLDRFKRVYIIDHHKTDGTTIKSNYAYIEERLSSVCEEITRLIGLYGVKLDKTHANYLLAGIMLDSFTLNFDSDAMFSAVSKLINKGAKTSEAKAMFRESVENLNFIREISSNAEMVSQKYAVTYDVKDPNRIFKTEDLAKVANDMLANVDAHAVFAIGYINEDTIFISARSSGVIDVSVVMQQFGGSGRTTAAAAQIKGATIEEICNKLNHILLPYMNIGKEPQMTLELTKESAK